MELMLKSKSYFRHKDKRLYFRYKKIFMIVCLRNPSSEYNPRYINGIGIVENEWTWISNKLMSLSYAIPYESEFYEISKEIINFLRKIQK